MKKEKESTNRAHLLAKGKELTNNYEYVLSRKVLYFDFIYFDKSTMDFVDDINASVLFGDNENYFIGIKGNYDLEVTYEEAIDILTDLNAYFII